MPQNSSFEHSWLLFLQYGAAKVTPCAPKGARRPPILSPSFTPFWQLPFLRPQIKPQGPPKWRPQAQNDPKDVLQTSKMHQNCIGNLTPHAKY